jgi:cation:H+ antiporter
MREAGLLFGLFWAQFIIGALVPESAGNVELVIVGLTYLLLGLVIFLRQRELIGTLLRDGFRTSYKDLSQAEAVGE